MLKKMILPLAVLFALTACDAKDSCLDAGGHYNEASKVCEK